MTPTEEYDHAKEIATLRAEVERLREWQRQMVQKAADNSLDGYRELGAKCASLEERTEKAERERDDLRAENERLLDEAYNARQSAKGENALRLEAERERDEARDDVARVDWLAKEGLRIDIVMNGWGKDKTGWDIREAIDAAREERDDD